jgi:hypothetical protein
MRTFFLYTCFSLLMVCGYGQGVETKKETDVDIAATYTTFRVDKGEVVTLSDQRIDENAFFNSIRSAVINELTEKGYKVVDDSSAQLAISYVGEAIVRMDTENLGPLGQQPASDPSQINTSRNWSREYRQGSIVLEVQDAATKKVIWSSNGSVELSTAAGDNRVLNTFVARSFKKFPKKNKKKK